MGCSPHITQESFMHPAKGHSITNPRCWNESAVQCNMSFQTVSNVITLNPLLIISWRPLEWREGPQKLVCRGPLLVPTPFNPSVRGKQRKRQKRYQQEKEGIAKKRGTRGWGERRGQREKWEGRKVTEWRRRERD